MREPGRWLPLAAVTLLAAVFAYLNLGEVAPVRIGIATFHRAPLVVVVFTAFLAGMLAMMALSLRQDLRIRRLLREHGLLERPYPSGTDPSGLPPRDPVPSQYDDSGATS